MRPLSLSLSFRTLKKYMSQRKSREREREKEREREREREQKDHQPK